MNPEKRLVDKALAEADYRYSKTMPWCPHHYTLGIDWKDQDLLARVIFFVDSMGVPELFGKNIHRTYYYANGFKYWVMGAGQGKKLINRAVVNPQKPDRTVL